jgi:hypothetical protein
MRFPVVFVVLAACASSQNPEGGGEAFCESYEVNYVASCRQTCDAGVAAGDSAGMRQCEATCNDDLSKDDTFRESCPERAKKLAK